MIPFGTTTPSITFPVGSVIEDRNAVMKVLHLFPKNRVGHTYRVKVLKWKIEVPQRVREHMEKPDEIYLYVCEESLPNITLHQNE